MVATLINMPVITSLSRTTKVDGWLAHIYQRLLPGDYTALFFTFRDDADFDEVEANKLQGKPLIVFDFGEYGYSESWKNSHLLGVQGNFARVVPNPSYYTKLDTWVFGQAVAGNLVAYFKRELTADRALGYFAFPIYPIELLSPNTPEATINKDQFMKRYGGIFHLYGNSHIDRKMLHASLQMHFDTTVNSIGMMGGCIERQAPFHLLEQVEWWNRYPLETVLAAQQRCQISIALPGYGVKCFRNSEACFGAVPAIADYGFKWAVPWTEENSILLKIDARSGRLNLNRAVSQLNEALQDKEALFLKAQAATEACNMYRPDYYMEHFVNNHIRENL